ncbi:MAG TPA: citrate/2-methylcitrate synthase [Armatimonadota bacterium]|jgi:citrate synthase
MMANAQPAGLEGIVAGQSSISNVYGDEGRLIYRGYDIRDLAAHATFEEVVYLLWNGDLPNSEQLAELTAELQANRGVPDELLNYLEGLPHSARTMAWLRTAVSALAMYDPDAGVNTPDANRRKAARLVAKTSTLTAAIGRIRANQKPIPPLSHGNEAHNFLYMLQGNEPDPTAARTYDVGLVLHADHEFNASTFTARVIVSTLADMYAGVTGAIGALGGPLHGGANEQVMKYLTLLDETHQDPAEWVREQLANKQKIPGFGHRVYHTVDPRASYLREMGREMAHKSGKDHFYQISEVVYETMLKEKGINANVDFFSASVFADLGLPVILYSPSFACSRMAGWTAHVIEQLNDNRIIRPRADYTGYTQRDWTPIESR